MFLVHAQPSVQNPPSSVIFALVMQFGNESGSIINTFGTFILDGLAKKSLQSTDTLREQFLVKLDTQVLTDLWQQTDGEDEEKAMALLNYLDFYLNAGQMDTAFDKQSYQAIIDAMLVVPVLMDKINIAIYGMINAPESLVQR